MVLNISSKLSPSEYLLIFFIIFIIIFLISLLFIILRLICSKRNHYNRGNILTSRSSPFWKFFEILHCYKKYNISNSFSNPDRSQRSSNDLDGYHPLSYKTETFGHDRSFTHRRKPKSLKKKNRNFCPNYSSNIQKCQHGQKLPAYLRKHSNECRLLKTLQCLVLTHYQIRFPYNTNNNQENIIGCGNSISLTEHCDALSQNNSLFGVAAASLNEFSILPSDGLSEMSGNQQSMSNDRFVMEAERSTVDGDSAFDYVSSQVRDEVLNPPPTYEEAIRRICTNLDSISCTSEDYRRMNNQLVWATLCDCGVCEDLIRLQNRRSVCQECQSIVPSDEIISILSNDEDITNQQSTSQESEFVKIDFDYLLLKLLETCNQKVCLPSVNNNNNNGNFGLSSSNSMLKPQRSLSNNNKANDERRHVSYADQEVECRTDDNSSVKSFKSRNFHQSSVSLFQPSNLYPVGEHYEENSHINAVANKSEDSMSHYSMLSSNQRENPSNVNRRLIRLADHDGRRRSLRIISRDGMSLDENMMNDCSMILDTLPDAGSTQEVGNNVEIDSIDFEHVSIQPSIGSTRAMAGSLIVPMSDENQINPETDSIIQTMISKEKTDQLLKQNIRPPSFNALKASNDAMKPPPPYSSEDNSQMLETRSLNLPSSHSGAGTDIQERRKSETFIG